MVRHFEVGSFQRFTGRLPLEHGASMPSVAGHTDSSTVFHVLILCWNTCALCQTLTRIQPTPVYQLKIQRTEFYELTRQE